MSFTKSTLQMRRTLKDSFLKVRALRARELREVSASLFFLALFLLYAVHSTIKPPLGTIMVENQRRYQYGQIYRRIVLRQH